jgi:hypothetical protein
VPESASERSRRIGRLLGFGWVGVAIGFGAAAYAYLAWEEMGPGMRMLLSIVMAIAVLSVIAIIISLRRKAHRPG